MVHTTLFQGWILVPALLAFGGRLIAEAIKFILEKEKRDIL